MGDDTDREENLLNQYINRIKERIKHNRSSISLNEDILTTKELYVDLKISSRDPEKYKNQETETLYSNESINFWKINRRNSKLCHIWFCWFRKIDCFATQIH